LNVSGVRSAENGPRAVVLGCAAEVLDAHERRFFAEADPTGFILFRRNCTSPAQTQHLVDALRDSVGRAEAPVLIDQEGGRVARLRPPHWRLYPPAARIAALPDPFAEEAAGLGARLIADDLSRLGITVDCMPVVDLPAPGADPVIGDRAYGRASTRVARLARTVCEGLLAGGVLPVLKHIPGHGRAGVDSHHVCPVVAADEDELSRTDFAPFCALRAMPWAMTAHIVYRALDPALPATVSPTIIDKIIRSRIGFQGVLISDDLSMQALGGSLAQRTERALAAGCDLVLHCNGNRREMEEVVAAAAPLTDDAAARLAAGEALRRPVAGFDRAETEHRFDRLLAGAAA
jgi:beta-N-acetylhexosaminidase